MSKKTMIRNASGNLFEKRPETCPHCKISLKSDIRLTERELPNYNVDPDDPYLHNVMEIVDTNINDRVGWYCLQCMGKWYDNKEES